MQDLNRFIKLFSSYTELRFQRNSSYAMSLLNGDCIYNNKSINEGSLVRAFYNGSWGVCSIPDKTGTAIEKTIKEAIENAKYLSGHVKRNASLQLTEQRVEFSKSYGGRSKRFSQKDKMDFLKEIDEYIVNSYPRIKSRRVSLSSLTMEKELLTSTGCHHFYKIPRTFINFLLAMEKDSGPVELFEHSGGLGTMEDLFEKPQDLFLLIDKTYQNLEKKCEAVYARAGTREVVLDAELAGILAHEAIGHTTEADFIRGGSMAGDKLNEKVASDLITLIDFANTAYGRTCPQPIVYDDEGVSAMNAVIIENGTLKGFMHNRETAKYFDHQLTGNARAFDFNDEPLIRMRNTCILPGKSKLEDMISSIEDGYYLLKCGSGQADSTSEFMFGVPLGFEIKNGRLGSAIKDTAISGVAFDLLKTVTMVSDDLKWLANGYCGKKQPMPVGMGGPAIKCKVNIGGE